VKLFWLPELRNRPSWKSLQRFLYLVGGVAAPLQEPDPALGHTGLKGLGTSGLKLWISNLCLISFYSLSTSDVNKDLDMQRQGLDSQGPGQGKDLNLVLKVSLRTRTRTSLTVIYCKLQLNLQSLSDNNNEHKVKVHSI